MVQNIKTHFAPHNRAMVPNPNPNPNLTLTLTLTECIKEWHPPVICDQ